jgi:RNA polymerase sigma-70 factor (ECF subfamily)
VKNYHNLLFPYAYNILGSVEDAKDAVQEVLTKYIATPRENVENEKGYLTKSVINQAINIRKSRKKVRLEDVWLPEPVATEAADTNINLRDIVSYSMLVLLEQLNPKERAVFILKEAFGYAHEEIAEVLSSNIEHSRKLLSRAKQKLNASKQAYHSSSKASLSRKMIEDYINAIRGRDTKTLENLLSQDIAFFADGGDKLRVVKKYCTGRYEVTELLIFVYHAYNASSSLVFTEINHQPALLYYEGAALRVCQVFELSADRRKIKRINSILDPDKLKNI